MPSQKYTTNSSANRENTTHGKQIAELRTPNKQAEIRGKLSRKFQRNDQKETPHIDSRACANCTTAHAAAKTSDPRIGPAQTETKI